MQFECNVAAQDLGAGSQGFVKNIQAFGEGLRKANFFLAQDFLNMGIMDFRVLVAHFFSNGLNQVAEEEFAGAELEAVTHTAASDTAKNVAAAFIARNNAVGNDKCAGTDMVGNDLNGGTVRINILSTGSLDFVNDGLHEVLEQVDFVVRMNTLKNGRNTFQAHTGIHTGTRQLVHYAFFITVELHEHEVPNFHVAVAVFVGASGRASGNGGAVVIENFGARTAGAGIAHHPEVVGSETSALVVADTNDSIGRDTDFLIPDVVSLVVLGVHSHPEFFRREFEVFGKKLPGILDGITLEVISEAEVAKHFKECVMASGIAYVFQVIVLAAGTNTFLTGRRTCVGTLVKAKVNILELVHTCVGKQQCGVVTGDYRAGSDDSVSLGLHELQKRRSYF